MEQEVTRIAYPNNDIMAAAWAGFIRWASKEPDVLEWFEKETGMKPFWVAKRTPLDVAIDKATGYETVQVDAFVDWATKTLWGEDPFEPGEEGEENGKQR